MLPAAAVVVGVAGTDDQERPEPPPPPPSVTLTMLPAAFFVNALLSVQLIASSCVSKSVVSGTLLAVYERLGFMRLEISHLKRL
jgi:hypothetical protein